MKDINRKVKTPYGEVQVLATEVVDDDPATVCVETRVTGTLSHPEKGNGYRYAQTYTTREMSDKDAIAKIDQICDEHSVGFMEDFPLPVHS